MTKDDVLFLKDEIFKKKVINSAWTKQEDELLLSLILLDSVLYFNFIFLIGSSKVNKTRKSLGKQFSNISIKKWSALRFELFLIVEKDGKII